MSTTLPDQYTNVMPRAAIILTREVFTSLDIKILIKIRTSINKGDILSTEIGFFRSHALNQFQSQETSTVALNFKQISHLQMALKLALK
jgi:hypothetical protein